MGGNCYRKVRISPHLAYRDKGIPDLIPDDAVLIVGLWLRSLSRPRKNEMVCTTIPEPSDEVCK